MCRLEISIKPMAKAKLAAKRQSMPDLRRNSGMIARDARRE